MYHMVFDVETIGLYGEPFAVGYVVVDDIDGRELASEMRWRPIDFVSGTRVDHEWVKANVPLAKFDPRCRYGRAEDMSNWFWRELSYWRSERDVIVWADCGYPVEAGFLARVVRANLQDRQLAAPYPLHDIATLALACGYHPTAGWPRLEGELPAHDPLADARQSARLLVDYIHKLRNMGGMYEAGDGA